MNVGPKILFLDTENAPNLAATWGIHDQNVRYTDIVKEWFFISGQWSWDNSKQVNTVSILDDAKRFKKDFTDDYHVVSTLHGVLEEADIVVGHNIIRHDIKKLLAKFIDHRLKPIKMPEVVDTLVWARKFGFQSRKLGDLCTKLGLSEKLHHEGGVFVKAAMGDRKAIHEIVTYGKGDITCVRELYHLLKPHCKHPNHNLFRGDGVECCPNCGSTEFIKRGHRLTSVGKFPSFSCNECGKYFQSGKSVKRVLMR